MSRKKPTTLYFYEHKERKTHKIGFNCELEVVDVSAPTPSERTEGILEMVRYRCRLHKTSEGSSDAHDYYGYGSRKEAKMNEIAESNSRISDEKEWIKKLTKPEKEVGVVVHTPGCELGDNYKDCPACRANGDT